MGYTTTNQQGNSFEINSEPLSLLKRLTVKSLLKHLTFSKAETSAKNFLVAHAVSLFCLRKYVIINPEQSSVKLIAYLWPSILTGSTGPAKSQCTSSKGSFAFSSVNRDLNSVRI